LGTQGFPLWKKCVLELVGTFVMSFFGPATIVIGFLIPSLDGISRLFFAALVPGIALFVCITAFASYSGSHVNPAITLTFTTSGSFGKGHVIPYVFSQLVGGVLGGLALYSIFDSLVPPAFLGSNRLGPGVSPLEGIALEVVDTFVLCLVVLWVVSNIRGIPKQGAIVGGTLSFLIFTFGPISGGSMNPYRSLGPALFSSLDEIHVYIIGPLVGAVLAGFVFKAFKARQIKPPQDVVT